MILRTFLNDSPCSEKRFPRQLSTIAPTRETGRSGTPKNLVCGR